MLSSKIELTCRLTSGALCFPFLDQFSYFERQDGVHRLVRSVLPHRHHNTHPKPVIKFHLKHFSGTCTPLEVKLHNSRQMMEIFELTKSSFRDKNLCLLLQTLGLCWDCGVVTNLLRNARSAELTSGLLLLVNINDKKKKMLFHSQHKCVTELHSITVKSPNSCFSKRHKLSKFTSSIAILSQTRFHNCFLSWFLLLTQHYSSCGSVELPDTSLLRFFLF